jgi:electron transport complex protein RnfB
VLPLNPVNGVEQPLRVAVIDERLCIGCTLCIQACPVDAIVGAARECTPCSPGGATAATCALPPCPMDCIAMVEVQPQRTWSDDDARESRARYEARRRRLAAERDERERRLLHRAVAKLDELGQRDDLDPGQLARKQAVVRAAIERARARRRAAATP